MFMALFVCPFKASFVQSLECGNFSGTREKNILGSKDIDNPKLVSNPLHLVKQLCTSKNVIVRGKSFPRKFLKTCAFGFLFLSHSTPCFPVKKLSKYYIIFLLSL